MLNYFWRVVQPHETLRNTQPHQDGDSESSSPLLLNVFSQAHSLQRAEP
jgi:hypothetical protein